MPWKGGSSCFRFPGADLYHAISSLSLANHSKSAPNTWGGPTRGTGLGWQQLVVAGHCGGPITDSTLGIDSTWPSTTCLRHDPITTCLSHELHQPTILIHDMSARNVGGIRVPWRFASSQCLGVRWHPLEATRSSVSTWEPEHPRKVQLFGFFCCWWGGLTQKLETNAFFCWWFDWHFAFSLELICAQINK